MRTVRFDGEGDSEFRARAERAAEIARLLSDACLKNTCVQEYAADPELPWFTLDGVQRSPICRVEYEEAIAIGDLGSALSATRSKHWGNGPLVMPLGSDDWFFPERITYYYRENSGYNQRFQQRQRLKELLGKRHRPLVETAKHHTKGIFLKLLTEDQAGAIRRILNVEPGEFWRAARGKTMLVLPPRLVQLEFDVE